MSARRYIAMMCSFVALGCGSKNLGTVENKQQLGGSLEVLTWWSSPSENDAFEALKNVFKQHYPGVRVDHDTKGDPERARAQVEEQIAQGTPPDTFPCLAGNGCVIKYASESRLLNLDELAAQYGWKVLFPSQVLNLVSVEASMYSVPLNVHRINTVIYNKHVFAENQLAVPQTLSELHQVCEALKQKQPYITPIATGAGGGGWTVSLMLLDSIFPAVTGGDVEYTRDFLRGKKSARDPKFLELLDEASRLMEYMNPDRNEVTVDWRAAVKRVGEGKAAMTFMGDWAKADLALSGTLGIDFDVFTAPGANNVFVFSSDTFPMTTDGKHPAQASAWLEIVASETGQNAFNLRKGSIPARRLSDISRYDAYGQRAIGEFFDEHMQLAGALSTIISHDLERDMNDAMKTFSEDRDVAKLVAFFESNYERFARAE